MANDDLKAACAANRDVPRDPPGPFQDCSDVVHLAVFFDGTGNNKDVDEGDRKWSNVARIWNSADRFSGEDTQSSTHVVYLSGVGTPYDGQVTSHWDKSWVWLEDGSLAGMGGGAGGDRRLEAGHDRVSARLRDVLIANARRAGGDLKKYADQNTNTSFAGVNAALAKHRLIKVINISIFGFSRGAALARAFSNQFIAGCKLVNGELTLSGYPVRMNFMGLFDTVASFGVPSQNATLPWEERDLIVSDKIERCVHFVAAHELRFSFPVDLIRKNGKFAGSWLEKTYPGVHSDVGGGYALKNQDIDNNYGRIPMRDMMQEAVLNGVRLIPYGTLATRGAAQFELRFECRKETEASYISYMRALAAKGAGGTIEQQMARHMALLYSGYGTMTRSGEMTVGQRRLDEDRWKLLLGSRGMAFEVSKYRVALKAGQWLGMRDNRNLYAQIVKPEKWRLDAWDSTAPDGVVNFVKSFIHDSKVDFVGNIEPFSYFSPRGVKESTKSVWQETSDWVGEKVGSAEDAVESAYAAGKKTAIVAYATAEGKVVQTYDATKHKAAEVYDAGKRKAQNAYDVVKGTATELYDEAADAANATLRAGGSAAHQVDTWGHQAAGAASQGVTEVWHFLSTLPKP